MSFLRHFSGNSIHTKGNTVFEMVDLQKVCHLWFRLTDSWWSLSCDQCYSKIEECLGLEGITRIIRF